MACPARLYEPADLPGLDFDPFLADVLRNEPVSRIRLPFGEGEAWLVTRYEDVTFVTGDPRFSREAIAGTGFPRMTKHSVPLDGAVSYADPPDHARIRRVVAKAFDQQRAERLRPHAERTAQSMVDSLLRAGPPADLVRHVTSPFPAQIISRLMGVPPPDRPRMVEWARTILTKAPDEQAAQRAREAKEAATEYFRDLMRRRLEDPRADVMSMLTAAHARNEISEAEALALAQLLQFNGWHAVRNNSSNMAYLLLTEQGLADRLRADLDRVPQAVEELLRYIPHKNGVGQPRVATEDVTIGDVRISAGDYVYVSYVAANWDPRAFPEPHRIDIDRAADGHLAFGHGPHYCMAPAIARMESQVLLKTLLTRMPRLRLAVGPGDVQMQPDTLIRGPVSLPVTW